MQHAPRRLSGQIVFFLSALIVVGLDQTSKYYAIKYLTGAFGPMPQNLDFFAGINRFLWTLHPPVRPAVAVFAHFWHYRYIENAGAAWGFLSQSLSVWRTPFFLCVSLSAMVFILVCHHRSAPAQRALRAGLALVFGGAIGNFIDRVRLGYVIDFIDWHYYNMASWPTFNVADAAISVGVGILLFDLFTEPARR